ncbi:hypothetical protein D3C87_1179830 [compost metagenome]
MAGRVVLRQKSQVLAGQDQQGRAVHAVGEHGQALDGRGGRHFRQRMARPDPVEPADIFASQCADLAEQRMRGRAISDLGFREQREIIDAGQAMPEVTDGQVDMAVDDFFFQQRRRQFGEVEVQPLVPRPQTGNGLADFPVRHRIDLPQQADVDAARDFSVDVLHLDPETFGRRQQASGRVDELSAFGRYRKPAAPALAQTETDPGFQRRQLRADRGLRGVEGGLRRRDAARFDDGQKYPDQTQIQLRYSSQHGGSRFSLT